MCAQPMDSILKFQAAPLLAEPQSWAASQTALSCVSTPKPCKPSPHSAHSEQGWQNMQYQPP